MIQEAVFWEKEKEAPLLNRNRGYITPDTVDKVVERAKKWVDLAEAKGNNANIVLDALCDDEASNRIFRLDAERTFRDPGNQKKMTETLSTLWDEVRDYHQGLGFVVAFLMLFLTKEETIKVAISLHRNYLPGYFKSAPVAYVRDAKVYEKILKKSFPAVLSHMESMVPPEAYCSKWFVGCNVHVLTFEALADYLEALLTRDGDFLFKYAMGLVSNCQNDLLATKDVSRVLAILRLDSGVYPDETKAAGEDEEGSFFTKIVEDAINFELTDVDFEAMRLEAMEEMDAAAEKRRQREIELGFDDSEEEIVFSDEEESNDEKEDD